MSEESKMHTSEVPTLSGAGAVEPTGEFTPDQIIETMREVQKPIEDPSIVCIDERPGVEKQPVRAKAPGGPTITGYAAVLLAGDWKLLSDEQRGEDVVNWYDRVVDQQAEAGVPISGHTDNHASGEKSSCGASDGLPVMIKDAAEQGMTDEFITFGKSVLDDMFDMERWQTRVETAKSLTTTDALASWKGTMLLDAIERHGGVVEVLNGDADPERDPENKRHGHWGEGIVVNKQAGRSNDRDSSPIPFFQVDVQAVVDSIQPLATNEDEFADMLHGAVLYTLAAGYRLTNNLVVSEV